MTNDSNPSGAVKVADLEQSASHLIRQLDDMLRTNDYCGLEASKHDAPAVINAIESVRAALAATPQAIQEASPQALEVVGERDRFEECMRSEGANLDRAPEDAAIPDDYANPCTQSAWEGWQHRAALSPAKRVAEPQSKEEWLARTAETLERLAARSDERPTHHQHGGRAP